MYKVFSGKVIWGGVGASFFAIADAVVWNIPFIKQYWLICVAAELICCFIVFYFLEYCPIKSCCVNIDEYRIYCKDLYNWLNSFSSFEESDIQEIHSRIKTNIIQLEKEREYKNNRIDKWLQILVIPVVLTILSTVIAKQTDIVVMIDSAVSLLLFFLAVYVVCIVIKNVVFSPKKRKVEQMKCFLNDLQGVLDVQFSNKKGL